jgi:hypothetical protein
MKQVVGVTLIAIAAGGSEARPADAGRAKVAPVGERCVIRSPIVLR